MEQEEDEDIGEEATTATWTLHRLIGEAPAMAAGGDGGMVQAGGVMAEYLLIMERGGRATQQGLQYSLAV